MRKKSVKRIFVLTMVMAIMCVQFFTFPSANAYTIKNTHLKLTNSDTTKYFMPEAKTKHKGAVIQFDLLSFESTGGWLAIQKGLASADFSYSDTVYFTPTTMNALGTANTTFHFFDASGIDMGSNSIAIDFPTSNTTLKFEFLADGSFRFFWAPIGQPLQLRYTAPSGSFSSVNPGYAGIQAAWGVSNFEFDNFSLKEVTGATVYATDFETPFITSGAEKNVNIVANYEYVSFDNTAGDGSRYLGLKDCNFENYFMPTAKTQNSGVAIQFDMINFESTGGWFAIQKGLANAGFSYNDMVYFTPTTMNALLTNTSFHFYKADGTDMGSSSIAINLPTKNTTFKFEFLANGAYNIYWAKIGQPLELQYYAPSGSFTNVGPGNAGLLAAWGVKSLGIDNFSIKEISGTTVFSSDFESDVTGVVIAAGYSYAYGLAAPVGDDTSYLEIMDINFSSWLMPTAKTQNSGAVIQFDLINFESTGGWFAIQKGLANPGFADSDMLYFTPTSINALTANSFHFFKADGTDTGSKNFTTVLPTKNTTFKFEFLANGALNIYWARIGQPLELRYYAPSGSFSNVGPGNAGIEAAWGVKSFAVDNFEVGELNGDVVFSTDFEQDLIIDGLDKNVDLFGSHTYQNRKPVSFTTYNISTENDVTNILPGTSVEQAKGEILPLGVSATFADGSDVLSDGELVKTGTKVDISNNGVVYQYTAVIYGDVDSDGQITVSDLAAVKGKLLKTNELTASQIKAADFSLKGSVSISDLLTIKKHLLEISLIAQA